MLTLEVYELLEPYIVHEKETGYWIGIKDDAPDEVKKVWDEIQKAEAEGEDVI